MELLLFAGALFAGLIFETHWGFFDEEDTSAVSSDNSATSQNSGDFLSGFAEVDGPESDGTHDLLSGMVLPSFATSSASDPGQTPLVEDYRQVVEQGTDELRGGSRLDDLQDADTFDPAAFNPADTFGNIDLNMPILSSDAGEGTNDTDLWINAANDTDHHEAEGSHRMPDENVAKADVKQTNDPQPKQFAFNTSDPDVAQMPVDTTGDILASGVPIAGAKAVRGMFPGEINQSRFTSSTV